MHRRSFLLSTFAAAVAAGAPRMKITAVEFFRLDGHRETLGGVDAQYQVNPLHIYEELRPKPYSDAPAPKKQMLPITRLYMRIGTDQGAEGIYGPIDREIAIIVDQQLRPFLMGKDPLAGETLWDQMFRSNRHSRRGMFMMAISAVDNTLWDLRGRVFDVPVYRLLGGPTRPAVEAYASCLGFSLEPENVRRKAMVFKNEGFRYEKWFLADGPGSGPEGLERNVALVKLLRETVGNSVELMFDVYQGWTLDYALNWAKQVEPYRPRWLEEAFSADKIEAFAQLRRSTSVPIATGEHFYGRYEVYEFLKAGAITVIQADPEWCGGITELVKICSIASLYDAQVIPHGHSLHAALHVVASQSPAVCPLAEYLVIKMRSYYYFEKNPPAPVKGRFPLPEGPGFGIDFDTARVEKRTIESFA